ncbi:M15 family metallopeptidase [Butyrivibrio sp. FCS014]|uniref:M15 family metallopeptidase n=1 Tax=Butyrivibrio sp. FCS014 TaxID=1408304 RepID=UPI0004632888|nr:M15 family metallopeptidase [Butyrivibrio sp. FCS014]
MNKKNIKDFILLAAVIILAAIGARFLAKGETLTDYAIKTGREINPSSDSGKEIAAVAGDSGETAAEDAAGEAATAATTIEAATAQVTTSEVTAAEVSTEDATVEAAADTSLEASSDEGKDTEVAAASLDRVTYMDDFYYEPISDEVFHRISGISYPVNCKVSLDELRYLKVLYVDFEGETKEGELICNEKIAQDLLEIFYGLYQSDYQIESIKLVDEFGGDDTASMLANNTSCFNYRVVEGTTRLSNHAYGLAIDLNPFYNPYITYNKDMTVNVSPKGSEAYADRDADFPYKIDENDLAYKLFKEHGFKWGGNWNNSKDYQHFEKK